MPGAFMNWFIRSLKEAAMCKILMLVFSCALVFGPLQTGVTEAADPSLVAHYKLDEGGGAVAYDSSANGHDGTLLGQPQWVDGPDDSGLALAFHPTDACTGIECPRFDPTDGTGQFSFTIWALWDGDETYHHFFTKSDGWGETTMMFQLELWGGSDSAPHFNRIGISCAPNSTPFYEMPKSEWTHLAFVYDGANMVVYLNGVDEMGPVPVAIGPAVNARTVIGVADNDERVWTGALYDVQIYSRPIAAGEVARILEGNVAISSAPQPENGATDVPRDVTLSWTAGEFAATHDVYFGTVFGDVNEASRADTRGVLLSQSHGQTSFDFEGVLALGQTYYWRVDEVNAAPDYTIFKGEVWSFTTEPVGYPIANIIATSNGASDEVSTPQRTVDGSGINAADEASIKATDMWLAYPPAEGTLYIQYDFDRLYKLHEMLVWNYNVQFEPMLGFGLKGVAIEYSENGTDWTALGDFEFARATATTTYTANTTVSFGGVAARYVRLNVNSGYGPLGQYGLSEVRFLCIPVQARQPQPTDGAVEVDPEAVLGWRAGRNAVSHEVYLGTDPQSIGLVGSVDEATFAPADLAFGSTYYWQIVEVNEADTVSAWAGAIWTFATREYALIDGFETYNDDVDAKTTIFDTWLDGWVNNTGSTVGYLNAPFAEQTIVHSGRQSMPLAYDNSASPFYSEAERTFDDLQDWTVSGADSLRLYFQGAAANSPQTLYVTLEDSAGHSATVGHGDPDAVLAAEWQEWRLALGEFGGVSLMRIEKMTIGVGNRTSPAAGGTGIVYIDDIAFGRPATE